MKNYPDSTQQNFRFLHYLNHKEIIEQFYIDSVFNVLPKPNNLVLLTILGKDKRYIRHTAAIDVDTPIGTFISMVLKSYQLSEIILEL